MSTTSTSAPPALVPREISDAIHRKKARYCRLADNNHWDQMHTIAHPDATFAFYKVDGSLMTLEDVEYKFASLDAWVAFFSKLFASLQVIHIVGPGDLEQVGPDEVRAVWGCSYQAGIKGSDTEWHHTSGGYYHETYKRAANGDWLIASLEFRTTYFKMLK